MDTRLRRRMLRVVVALAAALVSGADRGEASPRSLIGEPAPGRHVTTLDIDGEPRPALVASASFETALPARALLTFGVGLAGDGDVSWTYRVVVRDGARVVADVPTRPRARRWRTVALPLAGAARKARLTFDIDVRDSSGGRSRLPEGVLLGVAEPTVHDLADYGRSNVVLLISIDTLRRDHVGAYGYGKPTTPRLDALAREGILCDDAVSTSSWTLPAHLSMLTSADPAAHGGVDRDHGYTGRIPTLPALLRRAGFATRAVTSHLYVSATYGLDAGFDHLDFKQDRRASDVADRATDLLDRFADRPFFLFVHFYDPHWNYTPPRSTMKLFPAPAGSITGWYRQFSKRTSADTSPRDLQRLLALYDGEIRYTDDQVGRILDHLRERGLDRSTLVVVTSDHGEEFLEHGSWEHQKTLYEEVIRVPLLVSGPGAKTRVEGRQASLLDVAPTVLSWAGVPAPPGLQGTSLLTPLPEREMYGETDHVPDGTRKVFLRVGARRPKLILSLDRGTDEVRTAEWYDLGRDPGETKPGADFPATFRRHALDRWRDARARGRGAPPVQLTPEQLERLRALGYVLP